MTVPTRSLRPAGPASTRAARRVAWTSLPHVVVVASCVVGSGLLLTRHLGGNLPDLAGRCGLETSALACHDAWPARDKRPERLAPHLAWGNR